MEETKKWYLSKTVWTGVLGLIVTILVAAGVVPEDQRETILAATLTVVSALAPVLRVWFTDKKID